MRRLLGGLLGALIAFSAHAQVVLGGSGTGSLTIPSTATAPTTITAPITGSSYQWKCNGSNIGGATSQSYTESSACTALTVVVTSNASNVSGGSVNLQFFFPSGNNAGLLAAVL